jgi:RNA polymerase sigma factor (sigma-70 family)
MSSEPTVFVVDDDDSIRDSLSMLLPLKGLRVRTFASADEFLQAYRPTWRGCLLTDLEMPGMTGLDLQGVLFERDLTLSVVMLTAHGDVATTRSALKNGAVDFLEKPVDEGVLIETLKNAIRLDQERFEERLQRDEVAQRVARLTPRELDVLKLLSEGLQHREIGERLAISARTVEVHKARVMEKLECRTLAQLVKIGASLQPAAR